MVCYGMLNKLGFERITAASDNLPGKTPLQWDGSLYLQDAESGANLTRLSEDTFQLLSTLSQQAQGSFQFWLRSLDPQDEDNTFRGVLPTGRGVSEGQSLSAIVYGSLDMAGVVGDWLDSAGIFLQLPDGCFFDVLYKNPHCLSFDENPPSTTGQLNLTELFPQPKCEASQSENLTELYTDEVYEEAQQPTKITSTLHPHQKAGLGFLLQREKGWDYDTSGASIWKSITNSFGAIKYQNALSGKLQTNPPPNFCGGILADEMGLGKTCTMLSLITAAEKAEPETPTLNSKASNLANHSTLIVVPFGLLQVWEKQIREHIRPDCVRWITIHASHRNVNTCNLDTYDIVLTTYNTVALDWKRNKSLRTASAQSVFFSEPWHRVVLDEAHVIRNRSTVTSKAVCALPSERRWCITGTPIQNRLSDLFGLLRFLGVEPYNHFKVFENDVLKPWKSHNDKTALMRLLRLMKAISIRRPRSIVKLTDKTEVTEPVQFSPQERIFYEEAREGAINVLNAAAHNHTKSTYLNALQRINEMRYVCNHGSRPSERKQEIKMCLDKSEDVQEWTDMMDANGLNCVQCGKDLQEEDEEDHAFLQPRHVSIQQTPDSTMRRICKSCLQQRYQSITPPSLSPSSSHSALSSPSSDTPPHHSSKITTLVQNILRVPYPEKSVVFSCWTMTLAAVSHALTEAGITSVQYDGGLSRTQRNQILHDFATDASIRVILVSISCGGQGLDLTAANHAFLLEPQWNPMLEEQAMSRVHRLGQTRPVRLVRFIVEGTWEEKIRVLQERKRNLVDLIVDRRNLEEGDEGKKQLHYLRELIA